MSIRRFFDKSVVIRRLRTISGRRKSYSSTATVEGHIQGLGDEAREKLGIIEEKAWKAWFDVDVDIKEQDILVDENGTEFKIREIVTKDYGVNQHKEVILMEQNN